MEISYSTFSPTSGWSPTNFKNLSASPNFWSSIIFDKKLCFLSFQPNRSENTFDWRNPTTTEERKQLYKHIFTTTPFSARRTIFRAKYSMTHGPFSMIFYLQNSRFRVKDLEKVSYICEISKIFKKCFQKYSKNGFKNFQKMFSNIFKKMVSKIFKKCFQKFSKNIFKNFQKS